MKKRQVKISNADELNKNLSYSSPLTWIILVSSVLVLVGFFVWSFVFNIQEKTSGTAHIVGGEVSLNVEEKALDRLEEGQKVFISGKEGKILSIDDDNQPVVSTFALPDGDYDFYIVLRELKPIQFWLSNN